MPLIASRFHETADRLVDLATGHPITLRRLPPGGRTDEQLWVQSCEKLLHMWHEDLPSLVDYGYITEGRFEAYERTRSRGLSAVAHAAVAAFLGAGEQAGTTAAHGQPRIGMRLVAPPALLALAGVLDDAQPGHALTIACLADRGAGSTTFLRLAAVVGRRHGYVPVGAGVLDEHREVERELSGRSVLLLCDRDDPVLAAQRWFFQLGVGATSSHVLLRVVQRASETHDVTLPLEAFDADVLASCAHVYPRVSERRLRAAARESDGLPGRFLVHLRTPGSGRGSDLRVAEAHPAYEVAEPSHEPELEHPWRDLIASAGRLAWTGRRSAAERDFRQIASAAERRQIELAAATAEVELAHLLLARGRASEARELFATRTHRAGGSHHLATRAAIGLGLAHLLLGEFDAAESTFRVCRGADPTGAAIGLAWTLLAQGRDVEAERAIAPARESPDAGARATAAAVTAAIALLRRDLPATARAAATAHAGPTTPVTEAIASILLVLVHARITDEAGIEQHRRRALAAARAARQPLLVIAARSASIEARHSLGRSIARADLNRLLRLTDRVPPLLRAWLWLVLSRAHPVEPRRRDLSQRLEAFARTAGARGVPSLLAEPANAAAATDAATLVRIYESSAAPAETLKRVTEWLRDRVNARSVVIADAAAAPLARSGPHDSIGAVHRILQTRLAHAPWPSAEGLESGVLVRDANSVQGVIACRWPLSRAVSEDVVVLLAAAASIVGPAITLLVERSRNAPPSGDGIVGRSAAVTRLRELVTRAAAAPFPVLVEGESGAGKELVARAIHRESARRVRPSVAVNCAAISDDLFEAEVFGHARGAFTGAHIERPGLFEQADGGTLFLDEISELSTRAQAKLLRVLQEGEVRRLGESHCRRVDVRLVAASNKRLDDEAAAGRFRADLLFRLAVIRIDVPPLRARREDIPLLVSHYWGLAADRTGTRAVLSATAVARLAEYDWPGNVRELQNVIAALAVQVPRGRVEAEHVAGIVRRPGGSEEASMIPERTLDAARRAFERQFIAAAIARSGGRHGAAARDLGISRQGLAKLMKRLEIG